MPKSKKPRAFDPKHKELLDELAKWLGHEMKANPAEEPRALATRHLMEHGWNKEICKLCGAAKAIIDCVVSIDEQPASEVLQAIRKYRPDMLTMMQEIETTIERFGIIKFARAASIPAPESGQTPSAPTSEEPLIAPGPGEPPSPPETGKSPSAPESPETPSMPGPPRQGVAPDQVKPGQGSKGRRKWMWQGSISDLLLDVLLGMTLLDEALGAAEDRLVEGMVIPSLKEKLGRYPPNYVETRIDSYLSQNGWTDREIFVLHLGKPTTDVAAGDGICKPTPDVAEDEYIVSSEYDYIGDRVRDVVKDGKPPQIWGVEARKTAAKDAKEILEDQEKSDKARHLLEMVEKASLPPERKP